MKKCNVFIPRREFITSGYLLVLGCRLFGMSPHSSPAARKIQKLTEELTPEETDWVNKSSMAKDIRNYFGEGYSCAESLFMVSLKYLGKPEELVWIAGGFGGGMYHKDLCGFLTAGIMAMGLSAGMLNEERKEARDYCSRCVKEYWKWWTSQAPLRCADIRTEGKSSKICRRLGQLASAKVEELVKPARNSCEQEAYLVQPMPILNVK